MVEKDTPIGKAGVSCKISEMRRRYRLSWSSYKLLGVKRFRNRITEVSFDWVVVVFKCHTHWGVAIRQCNAYRCRLQLVTNHLNNGSDYFCRSAK